jgi:hypothetical protein
MADGGRTWIMGEGQTPGLGRRLTGEER